jgi:chloramphenicol-sensitive protein RarD
VSGGQTEDVTERNRGLLAGVGAYTMWGLFPLYFHHTAPTSPFELLLWRMLLTMVVMMIVLAVRRDVSWLRRLPAEPKLFVRVVLAALFLSANWGLYIWAINNNHVVEAALGYFINPLVTVAVGVAVLHERLRAMQKAAVALGVLAVVVLTIDYGRPPWIALVLAFSFASYGFLKKQIDLTAFQSLSAETFVMLPMTAIGLSVMASRGTLSLTGHGTRHTVLVLCVGVVTAVPLTLFAVAARRIPLVMIGLLQYLAPIGQMLCGVLVFHEHQPSSRWIGFAIVWGALALLVTDAVRTFRAPSPDPVEEPALAR